VYHALEGVDVLDSERDFDYPGHLGIPEYVHSDGHDQEEAIKWIM
jgi:hypothetical protein